MGRITPGMPVTAGRADRVPAIVWIAGAICWSGFMAAAYRGWLNRREEKSVRRPNLSSRRIGRIGLSAFGMSAGGAEIAPLLTDEGGFAAFRALMRDEAAGSCRPVS